MRFEPTRRHLVIVLVLVLWGLGTHGTYAGSGDEPHYLAIAHSIAFDGDLDVGNNYRANEPLIVSGSLEPERHAQAGVGGILRPIHDIGLPLVIAPYVRVAVPLTSWLASHAPEPLLRRARLTPATLYRQILSFFMIAIASLLATTMWDVLVRVGAPPRHAFWITLLLVASPPLLVYSTLLFTELLSAYLAFVVFSRIVVRPATTPAVGLIAGLITGFLLLVHSRNVGLVLGLSLAAAARLRDSGRWRQASLFGAGVTCMVMVRTLLNHHMWGTWITTPHAAAGTWQGWADVLHVSGMRFAAMLVDQEYGLLVYGPVYVLAIAGLPTMFKRVPSVALAVVVISGAYLLPVLCPLTNIHGWTGQWCPAGRFITPILPLLGLAVYSAYSTFKWAAVTVVALQLMMSAYFWQHPKLLWNEGDGRAAFCSRLGDAVCEKLPGLAPTVR
jgi:hypothetical protein